MRLWQWVRGKRGLGRSGGVKRTRGAVESAKDQWQEDGGRADQDYYHVPGAENPDRADPPTLDGGTMPKPGKPRRAEPT